MNSKNLLVIAATAMMFSSCAVKVGEVEQSSEAKTLDGTWATACMADSNDSYVKSFKLEDGTLTVATIRFTGSRECEPAFQSSTVIYSGKFAVTGDNATIEKAKNYEWTIEMVVGIPYTQSLVDGLNASTACGSNSWAIGQAGVILGCQITPDFDLTNVVYSTKHYGIYVIEQNATPLFMQFESKCSVAGYDFICPTENDRPTTTDGTVYFQQ